jgi:myo-inositol-1(or 4)-monophosphatase
MENPDLFNKNVLETIINAAKAGAKVLRKHYLNLQKLAFNDKGNLDIVSLADKEADEIIKEILLKKFPDFSFYSEEDKDSKRKNSDYIWIVDPLDGTNNFAIGMNNFAIIISLSYKQLPILSLIYNPLTDQYIWADTKQAYFMDQPIKLSSKPANPDKLFISIIGGYAVVDKIRSFYKFALGKFDDTGFRRLFNTWAPGTDFFSAAMDKIQGIYLLESQAYDLYQGMHILEKLGYIIYVPSGEKIDYSKPEIILPDIIIARDKATLTFMTEVYDKWQKQPTP